ncbi:MAG TPA: ATP-dependent Clp protease proteolytic subunit [Candidatus Atribacteria bacterium]|nr:ATP-dependent Clp protease proteolytic subunit [Candidatus Atribacteria bacterium]HPZ81117.1 ATP-dependent Clp protease proteolytic subunit [Candidatus Atribacteria bacterium]
MFWNIIFLILLFSIYLPAMQKKMIEQQRMAAIKSLERKRRSRVIAMIHRQESVNFLGLPIARYINIEDSEKILRAIHLTPKDMPIDLILHTPGGLVLAAQQIACAIKRHPAKVTVFVPHYAMSGGTLIALAADEIVMDPNAVLGPVDPQIGTAQAQYPAASILKALEEPNPNRDDQTLILGDLARKAINQVYQVILNLVDERLPEEKAQELATILSEGRWTHDFPITLEMAQELGLPAKEGLPDEIYQLMDLYPQPPQQRPSVEYVPTPYAPHRRPTGGKEKVE